MHLKSIWIFSFLVLAFAFAAPAVEQPLANTLAGQDLHISADRLLTSAPAQDRHILVFSDNFELTIGANKFSAQQAVVWLQAIPTNYRGRQRTDYYAQVFMQGDVEVSQGRTAKTTDLKYQMRKGKSLFTRFVVTGEVFATAGRTTSGDPNSMAIFKTAIYAMAPVAAQPFPTPVEPNAAKTRKIPNDSDFVERGLSRPQEPAQPDIRKQPLPEPTTPQGQPNVDQLTYPGNVIFTNPDDQAYTSPEARVPTLEQELEKTDPNSRRPWLIEEFFTPAGKPLPSGPKVSRPAEQAAPGESKPEYQYPVNISTPAKIEGAVIGPDGIGAATITGRFYVWKKLNPEGDLLEMQADNAVVFYRKDKLKLGEQTGNQNLAASGDIQAIYISGDVIVTEQGRTIRADEFYYDFEKRAGLGVNAELRTFDESRQIPVYVRAQRLRQISASKFEGDKIVLTTSEFYVPQLSLQASKIVLTDIRQLSEQERLLGDNAYMADMRDVRLKYEETTLFKWPRMQTNAARPDLPIRSVHIGTDNVFGFGVETRWYLSRLLGLRQPEGTDSEFLFDVYSKRGVGTGANVEYQREKYFGRVLSYIMYDTGEDRLGRIAGRKDVEPTNELRGRFTLQHRQFLADNWTLTIESSYISDRNFLEEYERGEFNTGKEQETVLHLKKIQDNWGLSMLAKVRINPWQDQLEELPTVEYHRTGESLFDDKFTFYSDSQFSRYRQRIGNDNNININTSSFNFAYSRNELDLPIALGDSWKFVPYAALTGAYDDRSGFKRSLVNGQNQGPAGDYSVGIGELGTRLSSQYWTVYPEAQSRLFDLNQIRHLVKPYMVASAFAETSDDVEQRDTANIGVLQRWQTKRGQGANQRTVDWMRLDTQGVFVSDQEEVSDAGPGPDRFIWNKPLVPMRVYSAPQIFNGDLGDIDPSLTRFEMWGPRRNMFQTDYVWRTTETLAVLSDLNYDIESSDVQQFDVGYSHLVAPNLSYYLGSRYLKRVEVLDEKGSNVFTAAVTYIINPRYTITFAQQYDFDYGANLRNEVTIIRRYHRVYYGLSFAADASLDRQSATLSIWPEGVPEVAVGSRRYTNLQSKNVND